MSLESMKCPECGAPLHFDDPDQDFCFCSHCGAQIYKNNDNYDKKIEFEKFKIHNEREREKQQSRDLFIKKYFIMMGGILILFALVVVCLSIVEIKENEKIDSGEAIKSSLSSYEYEKLSYEEAIEILEKDGFINIIPIKQKTTLFSRDKGGNVISVMIDNTNITSGSVYSKNSTVKITYYTNE